MSIVPFVLLDTSSPLSHLLCALGGVLYELHPLGIHASGFQMDSINGRTSNAGGESSFPVTPQVSRGYTF